MLYILLYLSMSMAVMAYALYRSIKRTLYSYANIVLIGGLLFNAVFLIACFWLTISAGGEIDSTYLYEALLTFPRTFPTMRFS